MNMGIPLYDESWTLFSKTIIQPSAPAPSSAPAGPFTRDAGSIAYHEICNFIRTAGWQVVQYPTQATGPYAVSSTSPKYWVGYDDPAEWGGPTHSFPFAAVAPFRRGSGFITS